MKETSRIARAERLMNGRCSVTGKPAYPTRSAAKDSIKHRAKLYPDTARNVYECPHCSQWHATTTALVDADRDPLRQPVADPADVVVDPWSKLSLNQVKGAHYALRVMRRVPATPVEMIDAAILELADQLLRLAAQERSMRNRQAS